MFRFKFLILISTAVLLLVTIDSSWGITPDGTKNGVIYKGKYYPRPKPKFEQKPWAKPPPKCLKPVITALKPLSDALGTILKTYEPIIKTASKIYGAYGLAKKSYDVYQLSTRQIVTSWCMDNIQECRICLADPNCGAEMDRITKDPIYVIKSCLKPKPQPQPKKDQKQGQPFGGGTCNKICGNTGKPPSMGCLC